MFNTMKTGMYCMTSGAKRLGGMAVLAVATPPLLVASFVGGTLASIKNCKRNFLGIQGNAEGND